MPLHPYGRHADVPQVFARLRQQRAADERIDLFVRMPADHHVVLRLPLGEQFRIAVVAHVRHEYQHVALGPQLRGIFQGHRLRVGKLQPRETRFIARRMPRPLVVGHHADEPDPDPVPVDDRIGRQLREGAGVAHHVGADHLEVHAVDHPPQERLPVVEFMVAQRRHVKPQFVHQGDHRHTGRRRHVHIGIPRPAVAGIDQHHQLGRIAARLDGRRQPREILYLCVHVVRRQQYERPFAGGAGRGERRNGDQHHPQHSFHNTGFSLSKL